MPCTTSGFRFREYFRSCGEARETASFPLGATMIWSNGWCVGNAIESLWLCGADPEGLRAYSESYPKLDPMAGSRSFGVAQVVSAADLVPYDDAAGGLTVILTRL